MSQFLFRQAERLNEMLEMVKQKLDVLEFKLDGSPEVSVQPVDHEEKAGTTGKYQQKMEVRLKKTGNFEVRDQQKQSVLATTQMMRGQVHQKTAVINPWLDHRVRSSTITKRAVNSGNYDNQSDKPIMKTNICMKLQLERIRNRMENATDWEREEILEKLEIDAPELYNAFIRMRIEEGRLEIENERTMGEDFEKLDDSEIDDWSFERIDLKDCTYGRSSEQIDWSD